jgi:hypothetical protein
MAIFDRRTPAEFTIPVLMTVDFAFAISSSLVRPGRPRYPVFVDWAAALLHAVFRPHLTMTPLRFANPCTAIRLARGLPPPSCRSYSAHRTMARPAAAPERSVAIEVRMDGALGGTPGIAVEEPDQQSLRILRAP